MERGFYNEDIEELLKQKADQYKMYPSDKVWKGVNRSLHPSRKWYWLGFMLFLSAIGYYAFVELFAPAANKALSENTIPAAVPAPEPVKEITAAETKAVIVPFRSSSKQNSKEDKDISTPTRSFVLNPDIDTDLAIADKTPDTEGTLVLAAETPVYDISSRRLVHDLRAISQNNLSIVAEENAVEGTEAADAGDAANANAIAGKGKNAAGAAATSATDAIAPDAINVSDAAKKLNDKTAQEEDGQRINWLHELAVYELQQRAPKRLSWQLAFTPTMSYRKLTSNARATTTANDKNLPLALQLGNDPDELVNHKPALGFELGSHVMYAANKTFTFRGGVQFNYSRYDIQAYSSEQTEQAFIALSSSTGITTGAITNKTNIRNMGGKIGGQETEVANLRNQYFMLSLPMGVEATVLGNDKIQLGIAATIQPAYLLDRSSSYLISTDYKNYTKEPSLLRKVNVYTAAEAFVAYKMGDLKWQVGPQFRYQLMSTYKNVYPIREHLMEFGMKIGVAKTIR